MCECHVLNRRSVITGMLAGTAMLTYGCSQQQLDRGGELLAISPEQARQMGSETWQRIVAEQGLSADQSAQDRIRNLGRRLVEANDLPASQWEFAVLKGDQANAFALPGGKVGVYEGMLDVAESDAQLATVIGHEIGHVTERHGAERVGLAQTANLGLQAVSAALQAGQISYANQIAAVLGAGVQYGVVMPYSRGQELEADRVGLLFMARGGYPPSEAIDFWQAMTRASGDGEPATFLSTHPANEQRIAAIRAMLPEAQAIYRQAR